MLSKDQLIAGRYQIIRRLGSGGQAMVYLVYDNHLRREFALKEIVYNPSLHKGDLETSLRKEADIMNRLNHSALPRIIDIIGGSRVIYVVMDYIQGETLASLLQRRGRVSEGEVRRWISELCSVLSYLHNSNPKIIYRDLKPSNIMIRTDGSLALIDFGAAREYKPMGMQDSINIGTQGYAAPEQIAGNRQTDARSDIYSLGVTMHYMLTGLDPCRSSSYLPPIRSVAPSVSMQMCKIVERCIQIDPEKRFASCAQLAQELSLNRRPVAEQKQTPEGRQPIVVPVMESQRRPKSSAAAIISIVVTVIMAVLSLLVWAIYAMN